MMFEYVTIGLLIVIIGLIVWAHFKDPKDCRDCYSETGIEDALLDLEEEEK